MYPKIKLHENMRKELSMKASISDKSSCMKNK